MRWLKGFIKIKRKGIKIEPLMIDMKYLMSTLLNAAIAAISKNGIYFALLSLMAYPINICQVKVYAIALHLHKLQ